MRHKLKDNQIRDLEKPGRYSDGDGLYLNVSKTGSKSWIFMWTSGGKRTEMGLGSHESGTAPVGLAAARRKAEEIRKILSAGGNPLAELPERQKEVTFGAFADSLIENIEGGFRNAKHRAQWKMTLGDAYCASIRNKALKDVDTTDVLKILQPIWLKKAETASRLRGRIERVIDAAKAGGQYPSENPARWKGHLDSLMAKRVKLQRGHHAALDYADLPVFWVKLSELDSISASALRFTILSAARTGETIGALWDEVDLTANVWTVPAIRMKAGRDHRVPLSSAAVDILATAQKTRISDYIFPGARKERPLSNMAMTMVLRGLGYESYTVHGFRSSFRDWAGEETHFPREIAEAALAHVVGDATERAYRRGDALAKRRRLMEAWQNFLIPQ